jgi:hypothetical protein
MALAMGLAAAGCSSARFTTPERYGKGLVLCVGGAGGIQVDANNFRQGLEDGGVPYAIEVYNWSSHLLLLDQMDESDNRRKACQLARRIENYRHLYPERPVYLVGVSAGTGLIVWALEGLTSGQRATGAVLVASSLSAKYDLAAALANVDDHIYNFYSRVDPVLGLGVPMAGTVDRNGGIAGGLVSFSLPDGASARTRDLYRDRLVQFGWEAEDARLGNVGDHLGGTRARFVAQRIAPLVLGKGLRANQVTAGLRPGGAGAAPMGPAIPAEASKGAAP